MSKIPCIEDKCILYPICISKFEIECGLLASYYGHESNGAYTSGHETWDKIQDGLPNLQEIHGPLINGPHLQYREYTIYKYPDPGMYIPGDKQ